MTEICIQTLHPQRWGRAALFRFPDKAAEFDHRAVAPFGERGEYGQEACAERRERVFGFQRWPAAEHLARYQPVALELFQAAAQHGFRADGEAHFRVTELCKPLEQTAYFAQMNYIDPFYFHGTSPALYTPEQIRARAEGCASGLVELLDKIGG